MTIRTIRETAKGSHREDASRSLSHSRLLVFLTLELTVAWAAWGLSRTASGLDVRLALLLTTAATGLGWWLSSRGTSPWQATLLIPLLGAIAVLLSVGRLDREVWNLLKQLGIVLAQVPIWIWEGVSPDLAPVLRSLIRLWQGIVALAIRERNWIAGLVAGEPIFDPVAVAAVWGIILWPTTAFAGWHVQRKNRLLLGMTPLLALFTVVLTYAGGSTAILWLLLALLLIAFAATRHDVRMQQWRERGAKIIHGIEWGYIFTVGVSILTILILAAAVPSFSVERVQEWIEQLDEGKSQESADVIGESLGMESEPGPTSIPIPRLSDILGGGGRGRGIPIATAPPHARLPQGHPIGVPPEPSNEEVMHVRLEGLPFGPADISPRNLVRYYWRGATYDKYTGSGWVTSTPSEVEYEPGASLPAPEWEAHQSIRQHVAMSAPPNDTLYAAGRPLSVDREFIAGWRPADDLFSIASLAVTYTAESRVSTATADQLRAAGTAYPDWVRERYLSLPEDLPERVEVLARDLTALELNPYDRARAIQEHIQQFPYTLNVPQRPEGRDVVDYFLFDLQKGYCDYTASSMAVLARAVGLPARYVTGYVPGTYDQEAEQFVVTVTDAHAWTEIFFPGYGWIPFEPSGRLEQEDERDPGGAGANVDTEPPGEEDETTGENDRRAQGRVSLWWLAWTVGGIGALSLAIVGGLSIERWWLGRQSSQRTLAAIHERLQRNADRLSVPRQKGDTPYEFGEAFAESLAWIGNRSRWRTQLEHATGRLHRLVELYVRASYTERPPTPTERAQAVKSWQELRWWLWVARGWMRWRRIAGLR